MRLRSLLRILAKHDSIYQKEAESHTESDLFSAASSATGSEIRQRTSSDWFNWPTRLVIYENTNPLLHSSGFALFFALGLTT